MGVELSFGPMLIGVCLNMILYGIVLMQMLFYFQTYKGDASWIRYLILYLFIIETCNTGFEFGFIYEPLIHNYGTPKATTNFPIMLAAEPITIVFISLPIQCFIAWRIWNMTKSMIIPFVIVLLGLVSFGGGIWLTQKIVEVKYFARKPDLHWAALVWLVAAAAADILITVALVWNLARRKTGFSHTDDVINAIIRMTVQTGLITAFLACLDFVLFLIFPKTTLNFICNLCLAKLYTLSLMSTLNARQGWNRHLSNSRPANPLFDNTTSGSRRDTHSRIPTTPHIPTFELSTQMSSTPRTGHFKRSSDGLEISVTKVVERLEDPHPVITINAIPAAHHPYGPGAMAPHGTQVGMLDSQGDSYDARSIGSAV
ncbi:uncharacterized protein SCHCODRAFT_01194301 [Schizophyllum commune H4-8]|uniref:DUF6534 domain-containing protein n=1 Tax=Schizophyllum commune (strain H4-8 / FGSC 9210) TaxID=578458 RepID=D8QM25_SCHCM|nr:uncharacterized protein SCHCODRAFT_01194301 [Schizophyllum commune H4-8]KAI5886559.1 hypothetical protein SCHCODRAFT_01194301 [Schizophyllum commune H4-8]